MMAEVQKDNRIFSQCEQILKTAHRFSFEAMAAPFEIIILHDDGRYAAQAAREAFDVLKRLEEELSRFVTNGDIARINSGKAGRPLTVSLTTFECLKRCASLYAETNRAFDVTIGPLWACWLNEDRQLKNPSKEEIEQAKRRTGMGLLKLDEDKHTVEVLTEGVKVDLGGFGKGYALEKMAELLKDWDIETALIHGGYSTVYAIAAPQDIKGWPVTLSHPLHREKTLAYVYLKDNALSGSGVEKGQHIIDPRKAAPVKGKVAAWSSAPEAGTADALSTAFMVMTIHEIQEYCEKHPDTLAMVVTGDEERAGEILHFGPWASEDLLV
jgi:thiamine biosynthesis lipoprotein